MQTAPSAEQKVPLTTRVRSSTRSAVARLAFDLSSPHHRVSEAGAAEMLIEAAFSALAKQKITAADFPGAVVGPFKELETSSRFQLPQHFRLAAGAPPAQETDEERRKREAEEQADREGPGPVGRPQRGKGLLVGEGPKGGPKKGGRR